MKRTLLLGVVLSFALLLNTNSVHAIVGGEIAPAGEFPSQVLIQLPNNTICGGTIINPNHVVTAARCVFDLQTHLIAANDTTIRAGILNIQDQTTPINVVAIFPHPQFNAFSNLNNIAVLRTATNIPIRPGQANQPAVAAANLVEQITPDATQCRVSGWNPTAGVASALLNFLRVAVLNRDTCNGLAVHKGRVHESMLCVGGVAAGPGVCPNTQGGGLFCAQNNNQNMFVGVLTGGFGCGAANSPGIYTQVRAHREWILAQLTRNDIPAAGPTPAPPAQPIIPPPASGAEKELASIVAVMMAVFMAVFQF